jgi:hypothetical protein
MPWEVQQKIWSLRIRISISLRRPVPFSKFASYWKSKSRSFLACWVFLSQACSPECNELRRATNSELFELGLVSRHVPTCKMRPKSLEVFGLEWLYPKITVQNAMNYEVQQKFVILEVVKRDFSDSVYFFWVKMGPWATSEDWRFFWTLRFQCSTFSDEIKIPQFLNFLRWSDFLDSSFFDSQTIFTRKLANFAAIEIKTSEISS